MAICFCPLPNVCILYIFLKFFEEASENQIIRILEPPVDFIFNFEICKFMTNHFKKLLLHTNSLERKHF